MKIYFVQITFGDNDNCDWKIEACIMCLHWSSSKKEVDEVYEQLQNDFDFTEFICWYNDDEDFEYVDTKEPNRFQYDISTEILISDTYKRFLEDDEEDKIKGQSKLINTPLLRVSMISPMLPSYNPPLIKTQYRLRKFNK